jgi:alpha/beta superfamily hydrolase
VQPSPDPRTSTIEFATDDGIDIVGDLVIPATTRAAAIVCHPHPQYGGNRFDHVVGALFSALPASGVAALRFDFRHEFGGGVAEVRDAAAAVGELAREVPDVPIIAVGYSFGAMVVLGLGPSDEMAGMEAGEVVGKVLVAPPLAAMDIGPASVVPTLVVTPEHDQFTAPDAAEPIVARWSDAAFVTIPMADHFLHGRTDAVVGAVLPWIDDLLA